MNYSDIEKHTCSRVGCAARKIIPKKDAEELASEKKPKRRADKDQKFRLPNALAKEFKRCLSANNESMQTVLERYVKRYVKQTGKRLTQ